ncbi:phosphatase PAP2 family protein [Hyalangium rubrum]|uniref:Phosphatase PAP2 family protein n=1 Tax=Hyalangium rubrum TaxID=3103134 RepID=A0ABU5GXA5_9BACT|nr:phosphatase PAP2 family protein [Hyalangium sp. s54d21]MDY7225661.1 phosphatase PAP2 family protein [Hyalangium sp. s54d21]
MAESSRLWVHERAQGLLALVLLGWLLVGAGPLHPATLMIAGVAAFQIAVVTALRNSTSTLLQKLRLASSYVVALALFSAPKWVVPALGLTTRDDLLLSVDLVLFSETPALRMAPYARPWLTELMSACYLSYHLYFHGALAYALLQPLEKARRLFEWMFTALPAGVAGYLLVPAVGPLKALARDFTQPLVGGPITALNDWVVRNGSAVYDVFPSLHVLMTCVLLDHDWREHPLRFKLMLPVAAGLTVSTVYLRYHYAIDLIAGGVWFLAVRLWWNRRELGLSSRFVR